MAKKTLEQFLGSAAIARRAAVEPRVVVRRFAADASALERAALDGTVAVAGTPVCELVAGDVVLARGEIVESDGGPAFEVREVVE